MEHLMTTKQCAEALGVSEHTIRDWRASGTGPKAVKLGGRAVRYRPSDVEAWLSACTDADKAEVA